MKGTTKSNLDESENISSSTSTTPTYDELTKKTKELEKQLAEKTQRNSDDIAPGIRRQKTFEAAFKNGYSDGTVKEAKKKIIAEAKSSKK